MLNFCDRFLFEVQKMGAVVFITGSSTGIGRLTAEGAARAGHVVYATMREVTTRNAPAAAVLQRFADENKVSLRVLEVDVSNSDSIESAVDHILRESGRIDAVVSNAGLMSIGIAEGFTEEQALRQMDVNFMGSFRVCRAVLPKLREQRSGVIIHVTSIAGRLIFPGCGLYCASKFAQEAFAEALQYELTGTGVESVLVEPGPYPSHLLPNSPGPADTQRVQSYGPLSAIRDNFIGHFSELFHSPSAPRTQDVSEAILRLIESPPGTRPFRTVCGMDFGAHSLNEQVAPIQADVLRALGMGEMVPPVASDHIGKVSV